MCCILTYLNFYRWGCNNEKTARLEYASTLKEIHQDFQIRESGLILNPKYPHLGASPDGLVTCTCCGDGLCEIKVQCLCDLMLLNINPRHDYYETCIVKRL